MNHLLKNKSVGKNKRTLANREEPLHTSDEIEPIVIEDSPEKIFEEKHKQELDKLRNKAIEEGLATAKTQYKEQFEKELEAKSVSIKKDYENKISELDDQILTLHELVVAAKDSKYMNTAEIEACSIRVILECLYRLTSEKTVLESIVKNAVKKAVKEMSRKDHMLIKVSPEDESIARLALSEEKSKTCALEIDPLLEQGSCLIESGFSQLDLSATNQIEQLKSALVNVYQKEAQNK